MADEPQTPPATGDTPVATPPPPDDDLENVLKDAHNPDAVKAAIDRQKADAKAAKQEAADLRSKLQEFEDRDKTAQQKAEEKATTAEQRASAAEAKALRFEVAAAKGVPLSQAHRLQGTTQQELEADAEEFLKDVKPGGGHGGQLDGGARGSAATPDNIDSMIRRAAGFS